MTRPFYLIKRKRNSMELNYNLETFTEDISILPEELHLYNEVIFQLNLMNRSPGQMF